MKNLISDFRSTLNLAWRSWLKIGFTVFAFRTRRNDDPRRLNQHPAGKPHNGAANPTPSSKRTVVQQDTDLGGYTPPPPPAS